MPTAKSAPHKCHSSQAPQDLLEDSLAEVARMVLAALVCGLARRSSTVVQNVSSSLLLVGRRPASKYHAMASSGFSIDRTFPHTVQIIDRSLVRGGLNSLSRAITGN